jgi:hypothetical protein
MDKQTAQAKYTAAINAVKREDAMIRLQNEDGGDRYEHGVTQVALIAVMAEIKAAGYAIRRKGELVNADDMAAVRLAILPLAKGCKTPAAVNAAIKSTGWTCSEYTDCRLALGIK